MNGIYKITSPTNRVYIGQSWEIEKRFRNYNRPAKNQRLLNRSLQKHGVANHKFEVVHELPPDVEQSVMDNYEQIYMDAYRDCGVPLLNIREGGNAGKHSEETKEIIRAGKIGLKHTDEHRAKISASGKGKLRSAESKARIRQGLTGMEKTIEHKEKISKARIRMGIARGTNNPKAKMTDELVKEIRAKYVPFIYPIGKLAREYGLCKSAMHSIVNGKHWKHVR